jgi:prophage regulatory protein
MTSNTKASKLLRLPQVLERYPVSKSSWYAGIKAGRYPKPVRIGERGSAWPTETIDVLVEEAPEK